jgi:molecular chaperone DnaJ
MASQDWFEKDFYAVLGVAKDATDAQLKKTYRKLARQYHPDSNPGDAAAETRFKEISEAYSVLSDPTQRAEYDQMRAMGSGARFTAGGGRGGGFEDVFGGFGGQAGYGGQGGYRTQQGGFEDLLGGLFGSGRFGQTTGGFRGNGGPTPGADITTSVDLDFATAIRGDTVTLQRQGAGSIKARIPAGVADGQKIRLRGKGQPSPDGGAPGDLVIEVHVRPHPVFARDGRHLRLDVPVSFVEAALGATIEVPTFDGPPVRLRVAPGTPSGRVLRVKGRGVETSKGTGDLLATVHVTVPTELSDEARERLEAFAEVAPAGNPRDELLERAGG